MNQVRVITTPSMDGKRLAFLLAEDRLGHYPEFREFFATTFELSRIGLDRPGYVVVPRATSTRSSSSAAAASRSPPGWRSTLVPSLEPLDERTADEELWAILQWMVAGVGGVWTIEDLSATGRLLPWCLVPQQLPRSVAISIESTFRELRN